MSAPGWVGGSGGGTAARPTQLVVDWATEAEDEVGATVAAVVLDELVLLLDVVVALAVVVVLAAVVEVELELDEELAPDVVLVLDGAELAVVVASEVVVSGTDDEEAVVSVVGDAFRVGSVTAADLGDNDWALAFESLSTSIPPIPVGVPPRLWPFMSLPTASPLAAPCPPSPMLDAISAAGLSLVAWIARGAPTASAVTVDNVRASRKRGRTGASRR